jgi:hypothetical protein
MTVFKPSLPPYKETTTKIGVLAASGLLIAAFAISSKLSSGAAKPVAKVPVVN